MSAVLKNTKPVSIDQVIEDLLEAKRAECRAKATRIALEEKVIAILGERDEGAKTVELPSGHKVTITSKLDRKLDHEAWLAKVVDKLPVKYHALVKEKTVYELDLAGYRWLAENDRDAYALVAQAVTTKKAKSSVEVKS